MNRLARSVLALLLSWPCFAFAQAAAPTALEPPEFCLKASAATVLGGGQTTVVPGVRGELDVPIMSDARGVSSLRAYSLVELSGLPGQSSVNPSDLTTVHSIEALAGVAYPISRSSSGNYRFVTSFAARYGFASGYGSNGVLLNRYPRQWGGGLRLWEVSSGGFVELLYGRAESVGDYGYGQLLISAEIPIKATSGALWVGGDAFLSVGHPAGANQTDSVRIYVGVAIPELVAALSNAGQAK